MSSSRMAEERFHRRALDFHDLQQIMKERTRCEDRFSSWDCGTERSSGIEPRPHAVRVRVVISCRTTLHHSSALSNDGRTLLQLTLDADRYEPTQTLGIRESRVQSSKSQVIIKRVHKSIVVIAGNDRDTILVRVKQVVPASSYTHSPATNLRFVERVTSK